MATTTATRLENFQGWNEGDWKPGIRLTAPSAGADVYFTLLSRSSSAGSTSTGIYLNDWADVGVGTNRSLVLGDQSILRVEFLKPLRAGEDAQNPNRARQLVRGLSFYWAFRPDYTEIDKLLDAKDHVEDQLVDTKAVRMELKRDNGSYLQENYVPTTTLSKVVLADVVFDELLFTTSRFGKVYFDKFEWTLV